MRTLGLFAVSTVLAATPVIGISSAADAAILRHTGGSAILGGAAILGDSAILGQTAVLRGNTVPYKWKNCTIVNQRVPHGVGRANAHDATSGTPVTSFRHDTAMYKAAMNANKGLDRDKDGIACEKR